MSNPDADQKRFIVANELGSMPEVAKILAEEYRPRGYRVPTLTVPNFAIRIAAIFDPTVRLVLKELGQERLYSSEQAETILGWSGRSTREMTLDMAESLIRYGVV